SSRRRTSRPHDRRRPAAPTTPTPSPGSSTRPPPCPAPPRRRPRLRAAGPPRRRPRPPRRGLRPLRAAPPPPGSPPPRQAPVAPGQSGLGRTGNGFAHQHDGIRPDGLILGKALGGGVYPVSALVGTADLMEVFDPGSHGSTFGGNPLAARIGLEALSVIDDEG